MSYPKMMVKPSKSKQGWHQRARNAEEEARLLKDGFRPVESAAAPEPAAPAVVSAVSDELESMTKVELLQFAEAHSIKVNQYGKKDELISEIRKALKVESVNTD